MRKIWIRKDEIKVVSKTVSVLDHIDSDGNEGVQELDENQFENFDTTDTACLLLIRLKLFAWFSWNFSRKYSTTLIKEENLTALIKCCFCSYWGRTYRECASKTGTKKKAIDKRRYFIADNGFKYTIYLLYWINI
jgi:hypothetical protein